VLPNHTLQRTGGQWRVAAQSLDPRLVGVLPPPLSVGRCVACVGRHGRQNVLELERIFMAISKSKHIRLTEKLNEQLRFIQRSCEAFDHGAEDEAIRIATSLRIIFHNTKMSVSLVAHLGLGSKKMLSSSRGHGNWQDYLAHQLNLSSPEPIRMLPLLGDQFKELSITDWWSNEPVFVHDTQKYSRQMIVLSAANKDGGAHVDDELEKYYEVLLQVSMPLVSSETWNIMANHRSHKE
jgi:hypothetical protein